MIKAVESSTAFSLQSYSYAYIKTIAIDKFFEMIYTYRKDAYGNVIAILDDTGAVLVKYIYDAWGNHGIIDNITGNEVVDDTHIGNLNPFRYRSYYYDTETDLYYLKSRYYDPELGRFISIDSIQYIDPETINGLNLYAYCGNNPVMRTDFYGTSWSSFWNDVGNFFSDAWDWFVDDVVNPIGKFVSNSWNWFVEDALPVVAAVSTTFGFVVASQIYSIIDSHIQVNKYADAKWNGSLDKVLSENLNTPEKRVAYINAIYDDYKDNWTKAQLYREIKYHYAGQKIPILKDVFFDNFRVPDIEKTQGFRAYGLRFLGNMFSIWFR